MKIFHLVFGVLLGKKGKRGKGEKEKGEGRMLLFSSFPIPLFFLRLHPGCLRFSLSLHNHKCDVISCLSSL